MAAHSVFPPSPYGLRRAGRVQEDQKLWLSASPVGEQALLLYCPLSTVHCPLSTVHRLHAFTEHLGRPPREDIGESISNECTCFHYMDLPLGSD